MIDIFVCVHCMLRMATCIFWACHFWAVSWSIGHNIVCLDLCKDLASSLWVNSFFHWCFWVYWMVFGHLLLGYCYHRLVQKQAVSGLTGLKSSGVGQCWPIYCGNTVWVIIKCYSSTLMLHTFRNCKHGTLDLVCAISCECVALVTNGDSSSYSR